MKIQNILLLDPKASTELRKNTIIFKETPTQKLKLSNHLFWSYSNSFDFPNCLSDSNNYSSYCCHRCNHRCQKWHHCHCSWCNCGNRRYHCPKKLKEHFWQFALYVTMSGCCKLVCMHCNETRGWYGPLFICWSGGGPD